MTYKPQSGDPSTERPSIISNPRIIPQGGGQFQLKVGQPVSGREKISINEAIKRFGSSRATWLRLYDSGLVQGERRSPRKTVLFVDSIEAHLKASRNSTYWDEKRKDQFRRAI